MKEIQCILRGNIEYWWRKWQLRIFFKKKLNKVKVCGVAIFWLLSKSATCCCALQTCSNKCQQRVFKSRLQSSFSTSWFPDCHVKNLSCYRNQGGGFWVIRETWFFWRYLLTLKINLSKVQNLTQSSHYKSK